MIAFEANVCPYCGHDYRMPAYAMAAPPPKKSLLPAAGGILILLAGIMAIAMGAFYFALDTSDLTDSGVTLPPDTSEEDLQSVVAVCGSLCVIFGAIAAIGGIFGIRRQHFAIAVIGGIFGLLGLGFLFGSLLALIGLLLLVVARKEFD